MIILEQRSEFLKHQTVGWLDFPGVSLVYPVTKTPAAPHWLVRSSQIPLILLASLNVGFHAELYFVYIVLTVEYHGALKCYQYWHCKYYWGPSSMMTRPGSPTKVPLSSTRSPPQQSSPWPSWSWGCPPPFNQNSTSTTSVCLVLPAVNLNRGLIV